MSDKESEDAGSAHEKPEAVAPTKQAGLFGGSGVQLTAEEESSSAAIKFLRYMLSQAEDKVRRLESFESLYFEKRQDCEVLKERSANTNEQLKTKKAFEGAQKLMIAVGSLIIGFLKTSSAQWGLAQTILLVAAFLLILGGAFPGLFGKRNS